MHSDWILWSLDTKAPEEVRMLCGQLWLLADAIRFGHLINSIKGFLWEFQFLLVSFLLPIENDLDQIDKMLSTFLYVPSPTAFHLTIPSLHLSPTGAVGSELF